MDYLDRNEAVFSVLDVKKDHSTEKTKNLRDTFFDELEKVTEEVLYKVSELKYTHLCSRTGGSRGTYTFISQDERYVFHMFYEYDYDPYCGAVKELIFTLDCTDPSVKEVLDSINLDNVRNVYQSLTEEVNNIKKVKNLLVVYK